MTAHSLQRTPQNTNYLQPTKFLLTFARALNAQYFCQSVNLPGISINELPQPTPLAPLYVPGNKINYEHFTMTFIVDEELRAWTDIHDWIKGMSFPNSPTQYNQLNQQGRAATQAPQPQYADGILHIHSGLNNPNITIHFADMFPVSLSTIDFTTTDDNSTTMTATATFRFAYFDIKRVASAS